MRDYLTGQLDAKVLESADRAARGPDGPDFGPTGTAPREGTSSSTLSATRSPAPSSSSPTPRRLRLDRPARRRGPAVRRSSRDALPAVPADGDVHEVEVPGHGTYRVAVDADVGIVTGLPTEDVDDAVGSLVRLELALGAARRGDRRPRGHRPGTPPAPPPHRRRRDRARGSRRAPRLRRVGLTERGTGPPHRPRHRGRPGRPGPQHPARPRRVLARRPAPQRAAGAPVRRRRIARAPHPADDDRRLHRARPSPPGPRRDRDRAGQGRGGGRPDDRAGRGPAAARPPRQRSAARPGIRST